MSWILSLSVLILQNWEWGSRASIVNYVSTTETRILNISHMAVILGPGSVYDEQIKTYHLNRHFKGGLFLPSQTNMNSHWAQPSLALETGHHWGRCKFRKTTGPISELVWNGAMNSTDWKPEGCTNLRASGCVQALNKHVLHACVQKGQRVCWSAAEFPPAVKLAPIKPHKETLLSGVIDTAPLRPLISSPGFSPRPVTLSPFF